MNMMLEGVGGIGLLMAVLFLLRMPVGFAMAAVGFAGLWHVMGLPAALGLAGNEIWENFSSYGLTVIPLFVLMGQICFYSGVNQRLYRTAYCWLGSIRGGMAMATVMACAGFSAISGSNSATAATMSTVALPEMKKYGYSPILSTGAVAAGSTLGVVIPPSVVFIIYGLQTGTSISSLFLSGVVPGLLLVTLFLLIIAWMCRLHPSWGPAGPGVTWRERLASLSGSAEMLVLFALVMGGMAFGLFTPSEAGAAGAGLSILLNAATGKLGPKGLWVAVMDTLRVSCMIFVIIMGAVIFGRFLAVTRLPFDVADTVGHLNMPGWGVMIVISVIYLLGGMIMDALALLLITLPIFFPLAQALGFDPVWFGAFICVLTTMGAISPPVGIASYVVAAMSPGVSLAEVFRGGNWFLLGFAVCLALMLMFPGIVLWLPGLAA
ncbi:TRAP dicarboxylate transporter, DctM subunit [Desulfovibrio sp. X2]|uniref:TRAP transporter large permease n=1 Tax=Desulfovibrio sp. X2 TaxID=941449 RepID=UPI0003587260|nr:TRAP transporter large permease [Desulfovibrio sp. X2]EPR41101.1 TRAP dicarboxylate transporter, DctM subunit [Desulfovibrio sp. X2]